MPEPRTGPDGIEPAKRNIGAVAKLERAALHDRSTATRISDGITRFTGSMAFAFVHALFFGGWLLINFGVFDRIEPFDPFPFSFLTLVVSLEAIFLSVFVLMSQNRMMQQADSRAHLDLQVDLLAEQELTAMLHMLFAVCAKLDVPIDVPEERVRALAKDTDVHELVSALNRQLPPRR